MGHGNKWFVLPGGWISFRRRHLGFVNRLRCLGGDRNCRLTAILCLHYRTWRPPLCRHRADNTDVPRLSADKFLHSARTLFAKNSWLALCVYDTGAGTTVGNAGDAQIAWVA